MKVLVTGHRGLVGESVVQVLTRTGVDWVGLDVIEGDDILDVELVSARATGCDAIVHLAAVEEDDDSDPVVPTTVTRASHDQVLATNIDGTRNVLRRRDFMPPESSTSAASMSSAASSVKGVPGTTPSTTSTPPIRSAPTHIQARR